MHCCGLTLHRLCLQTRYVVKYRHCDGKLVLKVTNDRVCLKFATDQAQDAKRMEKLNNLFFSYMCGKDPHQEEEDGAPPLGHVAPISTAMRHGISVSCRFSHAEPMAPTGGKPVSVSRLVETLACHEWRWESMQPCTHQHPSWSLGHHALEPPLAHHSLGSRFGGVSWRRQLCDAAQWHLSGRCCLCHVLFTRRAENPTVIVTDLLAQARSLRPPPRRLRAGEARVPQAARPTKRGKGSDDETGRIWPRTLQASCVLALAQQYGTVRGKGVLSCSPSAVSVDDV